MNVNVDHTVQILDGGMVMINDTVSLSTKPEEHTSILTNYLIGFPLNYSFNLDHCFAYDSSNPDTRFETIRDVGLGRSGYYGVEVVFPEPIDLGNGGSHNFTVVFTFSNLVSSANQIVYNLDFPMYPSMIHRADTANVTVILPPKANYTDSSFRNKEFEIRTTMVNSKQAINHQESPLYEFALEPAWLTFEVSDELSLFNVSEMKREVKLDEWRKMFLTDSFLIKNKAESELSSVEMLLPHGAYDVSAWDEVGELSVTEKNASTTVILRRGLESNDSTRFTVTYRLPWESYVNHYGWDKYNFSFSFISPIIPTISRLVLTVTLPEGAVLQNTLEEVNSLKEDVFQESITFVFYDLTSFHEKNFSVEYSQFIFWASFRPTLWVAALIAILSTATIFRRAPQTRLSIIPVSPEILRRFVESYEEKKEVLADLGALEQEMRRRRISRRRYKARRRTMEGRLSSLSRDLSSLREKILSAGPLYADMVRIIEVAETEIEDTETNIRRVKIRYSRKEISSSTYRKLLRDYNSRRERAETTIEGVLIRLRGELS
jgi:hypothetical protein